ncbi:DegT/DnrJ/EryC1/StrS family aminotransferase [Spongiactinospora sp. TRM90649]|uniref:DegT/DnrJ/EryC1/StrS family aminotransferase n=1 Tax=Spongiactinospora sp. TRM90649 TaxID=3031114 RepID=UPI0023F7C01B|nr:DegT/DnrJ/EryC1/StrS family aminotransferase [Spongiactinospora sp. TRM90649]MDF5757256.1 DegT/DnrJ/EryC1/StrS family aminotransferase [Spongiactinospora sp. TRM90649]
MAEDAPVTLPTERRIGRHCLYVPSARLGLYLAFTGLVPRGSHVLMSPVNCETVLFAAVAAGLRPVMAPVSPADGTIDVGAVNWDGVGAVLATHLYGLPGDIERLAAECERRGVVLVEDCAHAFQTEVGGRHVGTFGDAGVFSLAKHPRAGGGGLLALADDALADRLAKVRDELLTAPATGRELPAVLAPVVRDAVFALRLSGPAWRAARALRIEVPHEHDESRVRDLAEAAAAAPAAGENDLARFDRWMSVGGHGYRAAHGGLLRGSVARRVRMIDSAGARRRRLDGMRLLSGLPTVAEGVARFADQPLFRVPLLVADRDAAREALERRGVITTCLYTPPLDDDFGPAVADPGPTPDIARWWTRHALPVDPLQARRALPVLRGLVPAVRR